MNPLSVIRLYRYYLASGIGRRNARLLTWSRVTGQAKPLILESPSGSIRVRPQSTDMLMARDVLWREEYAFHFKKQPKLIVDAGANTGSASIYFHLRFPGAKIIAIELDPGNYKMLCANLLDLPVHTIQQAL